jgi:hypothetical protein
LAAWRLASPVATNPKIDLEQAFPSFVAAAAGVTESPYWVSRNNTPITGAATG